MPSYPKFEKDLFISYAHIDNEPLTPADQPWINEFHQSLEAFLNTRLGARSEIWRDIELRGNDVFSQEIVDQFSQTAVLVSILSPRYVESEWCTREISEFCEIAEQRGGGLVVDNKARVFKIIKTPVKSEEALPEVLKGVLGYEFYTDDDGSPLELDPEESPKEYKRKINKLAWDIAELLQQIKSEEAQDGAGQAGESSDKPTVYLAECSYDRKADREILEGDLRQHGYNILPNRPLPRDEGEYVAAVQDLINHSNLAIHLVGEGYGAVPDGPSSKSVPMLQNELAAERSKDAEFLRIVWLPKGTNSKDAPQQGFIEALQQDAETQSGADLITGDLEDLKTAVHSTLKKLEKPKPAPAGDSSSGASGAATVYLICDEKDRKATVPLRKFLRAQGVEVDLPVFEGDSTTVREAHQQHLGSCDAVILFYGAGDEAWKHTQDNDLKKLPAYREGKDLPASFTYLAGPATAEKEDLIDMEEENLIDGLEGFLEDSMAGLLEILVQGGPAS